MACSPPYCVTSGGLFCGCDCKCCAKCPCVTKISWLVVTGTDPILYEDPCTGLSIECTAGPGLRRRSNGIILPRHDTVQTQAPPPCIIDGEEIYYPPEFATVTLEFDGCCLVPSGPSSKPTIYNSTLWTAQNDGIVTVTRPTVCGDNVISPILKIGDDLITASTFPLEKCTSLFISFAPCCTVPCCLVCGTLKTFYFPEICGGGQTDPCASSEGGGGTFSPFSLRSRKTSSRMQVDKNALFNRIKKSIKVQRN